MKPLSKHCLVLKQCVICVSSEAACLPLLRALGSDPTGDPKRQELLPGVSTAHPSSGFGFRGPAGWRDPYGRVLQRGFHRWRERLVEMYSTCWQSVSSGSILLIFFFFCRCVLLINIFTDFSFSYVKICHFSLFYPI